MKLKLVKPPDKVKRFTTTTVKKKINIDYKST